ncbi:unnamed protein product, partial [Choristocarpus tenellus]
DRDYTIPHIPPELEGLRLTCVQTAQGDKWASATQFWRLTLMQVSTVLICYDARASEVPLWLSTSGFRLWEGVEISGAQYKVPYSYKRSYFVLVHVPSPCVDYGGSPEGPGRIAQLQGQGMAQGLLSQHSSPSSGLVNNTVEDGNDWNAATEEASSLHSPVAVPVSKGTSATTANTTPARSSLSTLNREAREGGADSVVSVSVDGDMAVRRGSSVGGSDIIIGGLGGKEHRRGDGMGGYGLQRISPVWDTEAGGPLSQFPIPFDVAGRSWSRCFNVDAVNTAGPVDTSGATFGVSVSALPGVFQRTRVVTLYPRLILRNCLGVPLQVMPVVMAPKSSVVERLSARLPPPGLPAQPPEQAHLIWSRVEGTPKEGVSNNGRGRGAESSGRQGLQGSRGHRREERVAYANDVGHFYQDVPTLSSVIIYSFNPVAKLVQGLVDAAAAASASDVSDEGSDHRMVGGAGNSSEKKNDPGDMEGDAEELRKCILVRVAAEGSSTKGERDFGDIRGGAVKGRGSNRVNGCPAHAEEGFGAALAAGLSRPLLAEEMGETHLWVVDECGRRHLAAAVVTLQKATVFLTISAAAQFPPFRVENRSSSETVVYRQEDANPSFGWHVLPPLTWHSFLWQEPGKPRAMEAAFVGAIGGSGVARHSEVYELDAIGEREALLEKEPSLTRSVLHLVST